MSEIASETQDSMRGTLRLHVLGQQGEAAAWTLSRVALDPDDSYRGAAIEALGAAAYQGNQVALQALVGIALDRGDSYQAVAMEELKGSAKARHPVAVEALREIKGR